MGRTRKVDPLAKRRDETDLQWRARIARVQETRRNQGEDIVTAERLAKGDLQPALSPDQERARTYRARSTSSLARLAMRGALTKDQLAAAEEIGQVALRIASDVGYASGSVEARVDCGNSGRAYGEETLYRVQIEQAYNRWRLALALPRGMVLDMVKEDNKLAAIARRYNRSWGKAMEVLKDALNEWPRFKREAFDGITDDDVARADARAA
jgi:hypothetical protein